MTLGTGGQRTALSILIAAFCVAVAACSPATRYRVLSFFFDGVPPPPGMEVEEPERPERAERYQSPFAEGLATLRERPRPPRDTVPVTRVVSIHEPYQANNCRACHDTERDMLDIVTDAALCDRCHLEQRVEEEWDHGPINIGTCVPCHVPHASVHEALLETPVPELCLDCHVDVTGSEPHHLDEPDFPNCVSCHDPHRMY